MSKAGLGLFSFLDWTWQDLPSVSSGKSPGHGHENSWCHTHFSEAGEMLRRTCFEFVMCKEVRACGCVVFLSDSRDLIG